jgi:hypothetical protein
MISDNQIKPLLLLVAAFFYLIVNNKAIFLNVHKY